MPVAVKEEGNLAEAEHYERKSVEMMDLVKQDLFFGYCDLINVSLSAAEARRKLSGLLGMCRHVR